MKKMTLEEFKELLDHYGIQVDTITDTHAFVKGVDGTPFFQDTMPLPNSHNNMPVYGEWSIEVPNSRSDLTLYDLISRPPHRRQPGDLIMMIKIVRKYTGYGLLEAKLLVVANKEVWYAYPEMKRIKATSYEDLPLLINEVDNMIAKKYLAGRLADGS